MWSTGSIPALNIICGILNRLLSGSYINGSDTEPSTQVSFPFFVRLKSNRIFSVLLVLLMVIGHNLDLLKEILAVRSSADVIILDRFIHDTIIKGLFPYGQGNSFLSRLFLTCYPIIWLKPDIIIVLTSDPKTLKARRPDELTMEEAYWKTVSYKSYSSLWQAYLINTTSNFEDVHNKLLNVVSRRFYERTR